MNLAPTSGGVSPHISSDFGAHVSASRGLANYIIRVFIVLHGQRTMSLLLYMMFLLYSKLCVGTLRAI